MFKQTIRTGRHWGVSRELDAARSPVHRTALENALRFLDDELRKV